MFDQTEPAKKWTWLGKMIDQTKPAKKNAQLDKMIDHFQNERLALDKMIIRQNDRRFSNLAVSQNDYSAKWSRFCKLGETQQNDAFI